MPTTNLPTAIGALVAAALGAGCSPTPAAALNTPPPTAATPAPTLVADAIDEPLLPPFTPSSPCGLQNDFATVSDESYCRSERITETVAARGDGVLFIQQTHHLGYGCWSGINTYKYALYVCDTASGARTRLFDQPTTPLAASPDGNWLAFGVIDQMNFDASVYKIRADGSDLRRLDTQPLPEPTVGVNVAGWSTDGEWIDLSLWDGTEDGWHPARLRADGSGDYEFLPGEK